MDTFGSAQAGAGKRVVPWPAVALIAAVALAGLAGPTTPAAAQGWIDPPPGVTSRAVVRIATDVRVRVEGRIAHVEVEEWFENRGRGLGEGDYLYPLPGEAVFSDFSLYQGDDELRGETMDASRARAIYEEIVRRHRDPALIELVGHGLVRARVFPIEPGQRRKITLRYTQLLDRAGDALQFRYAAGGAYAHRGAVAVPRPPRPIPVPLPEPAPMPLPEPELLPGPRPLPDDAPIRFTLSAHAGAFGQPFSPTHRLRVERRDGRLTVATAAELRGDLSVFLPLATDLVSLALATHRPSSEPGYFMLTLSPGTVDGPATPRDIVVVADVSGSMSGEKMEQTRTALHQLLGSLSGEDRIRLIAFSSTVRTATGGWIRPDAAGLAEARRWVDGLRASGGTNIAGALEEAFRLDSPADRLPIVIFMTDGLPTVGERDPERIAAAAEARRGRARVFAFGVGYDVNTYLLDRLSAAGRGATAYVQPGENVELALGTLAVRITHPVLTDLEIAGSPVHLTELYPIELPDLFAGDELVLFGRYEAAGRGELRVAGRRAGRVERFATTADFSRHTTANDFIPRLWASRKLGVLTRQARLNGNDAELVAEIRETALRYGLLSEYTAYLVQEPGTMAIGPGPARRDGPVLTPGLALDAVVVTGRGAPAATAATGAAAVRSAEAARLRREVSTAADLAVAEAAQRARVGDAAVPAGRADVRVVAGRTFRLRDEVWIEAGPEAERVVVIRRFGVAYFALLEAAPELRPVAVELDRVVVRGARVAIRFDDDGAETMTPERVRRLVAEFRGK